MELKELRSLYWRAVQIVENSEDYEFKDAYNKIFSEDIYGQSPHFKYENDDCMTVEINNFLTGFQKYIEEVEARELNQQVEISEFNQDLMNELVELRKFKLNSNTNQANHAIQFADWVGENYDQNPNGTWGDLNRTTEDLYKVFIKE